MSRMSIALACVLISAVATACVGSEPAPVPQWTTFEITLESKRDYDNPYTDVDVWCVFTNQAGDELRRPAFWDGGNVWKVRFAPVDAGSRWTWISAASDNSDAGLHHVTGELSSTNYVGENPLIREGLLRMSPQQRSVLHHSGASFLMVGDTAWSIPFRATLPQVQQYAQNRKSKGFNTTLLSVVQPDRQAVGPDERNTEQGFARAFHDLEAGHMKELSPAYFQTLDNFVNVLLEHEIVPVYAVMLHGYGWKGQGCLGNSLEGAEYVRFCKYLLARYGSAPAMWLLSVDGAGNAPGIVEGGQILQEWDCYGQPTGIHYNPCDDFIATWAKDLPDPLKYCMHGNKSHQDANWLDFQWAQTGHGGEHQYHKVEQMYDNLPIKAVANGEPTYEGMDEGKNGLGWWQGEEAWMQLMSGGTMGVVYGSCSIWRWKITDGETGWDSWTEQQLSWKNSLDLEGSSYVGILGKILSEFDLTDIQRRWDLADGKPLLAIPGSLYVAYLNAGGTIEIEGVPVGMQYHWADPRTGMNRAPMRYEGGSFTAPTTGEWVLIVGKKDTSR